MCVRACVRFGLRVPRMCACVRAIRTQGAAYVCVRACDSDLGCRVCVCVRACVRFGLRVPRMCACVRACVRFGLRLPRMCACVRACDSDLGCRVCMRACVRAIRTAA